jgi:hypothetical protein
MMRLVALALIASLALPACSARAPVRTAPAHDADLWRRFARDLPAGSPIDIHTTSNGRMAGTLIAVDDTALVLDPATRIREPLRRIAFDGIDRITLRSQGLTLGKAAAVGAGVGAGAFMGLMLLVFAIWED